jgi:hypothetical protein
MGSNQNKSAGSGRHTERGSARLVGGGGSRGRADDPDQAYLDLMREKEIPAALQFEFIRTMEADDGD